jgi:hypothetical protein
MMRIDEIESASSVVDLCTQSGKIISEVCIHRNRNATPPTCGIDQNKVSRCGVEKLRPCNLPKKSPRQKKVVVIV